MVGELYHINDVSFFFLQVLLLLAGTTRLQDQLGWDKVSLMMTL